MTPPRIAALDVTRGLAVMGILVANMPAFGLPEAAYFSPLAAGGSTGADRVVWATTFVLVEGKMRGLFTMLFGASLLLVVDRAHAAGNDAARVHYPRMFWLFAFGYAHLYLFWWGDILTHYALVGAVAFLFAPLSTRWLVGIGLALVANHVLTQAGLTLIAFSDTADAALVATRNSLLLVYGVPPASTIAAEVAANRGGFGDAVAWRWANAPTPFRLLNAGTGDTLGFMLFGMAGLRSGFLTGAWPRERYRRWATVSLAIALPAYAGLAAETIRHDFAAPWVVLGSAGGATLLRPLAVAGYAALAVLAASRDGWLQRRVAAVGRAAFSNYLGTTLVTAALFQGWGLGLFGALGRAQLYLVVPLVWALMLAWSTPWLARYRYGPLEWAWRSLSRGEAQPMRRYPA